MASGDFNNDGVPDLAVAVLGDGGPDGLAVLLGNSSAPGTFGGAVHYPTAVNPVSVVTGDFNRDSMLDLAVGTSVGGGAPS